MFCACSISKCYETGASRFSPAYTVHDPCIHPVRIALEPTTQDVHRISEPRAKLPRFHADPGPRFPARCAGCSALPRQNLTSHQNAQPFTSIKPRICVYPCLHRPPWGSVVKDLHPLSIKINSASLCLFGTAFELRLRRFLTKSPRRVMARANLNDIISDA